MSAEEKVYTATDLAKAQQEAAWQFPVPTRPTILTGPGPWERRIHPETGVLQYRSNSRAEWDNYAEQWHAEYLRKLGAMADEYFANRSTTSQSAGNG